MAKKKASWVDQTRQTPFNPLHDVEIAEEELLTSTDGAPLATSKRPSTVAAADKAAGHPVLATEEEIPEALAKEEGPESDHDSDFQPEAEGGESSSMESQGASAPVGAGAAAGEEL